MRSGVGAVLWLSAFAVFAQGAQASTYYASPSGGGSACTTSSPCSLREAANKVWVNDEVVLAAGDYAVGSTPVVVPSGAQNVYIHGDYSGPMPHISGTIEKGEPIYFNDTGGHIAYMEIVNEAPYLAHAASCILEGLVERVRLIARGPNAVGLLQGPGCTVRDSLVRAEGFRASAIHTTDNETSTKTEAPTRNVTAIARGPESIGIKDEYLGVGPTLLIKLILHNSIASGTEYDLAAVCPDPGFGKAVIFVGNSNFATTVTKSPGFGPPYPPGTVDPPAEIVEDIGNQRTPPLFVDAAAGDFREAGGSPTIDAGQTRDLGLLDPDGTPRVLGAAPDIGAYEFVPPTVPPPPRPIGKITSLKLSPPSFHALGDGERPRGREAGTMASYRLTAPADVRFSVEHKIAGRIVNGRCRKHTRFNDYKRPCRAFVRMRPSFSRRGRAGRNRFKFLGRLGGEALEPGAYRLVASAGGATRRALFRVVD
jgi:hypothetical protein